MAVKEFFVLHVPRPAELDGTVDYYAVSNETTIVAYFVDKFSAYEYVDFRNNLPD